MKAYRQKLISHLIISIIYLVISIIFIVRAISLAESAGTELEWNSATQLFLFSIVIAGVSLWFLCRAIWCLLSANHFKKVYIRHTDERLVQIRAKAGTSLYNILISIEVFLILTFAFTNIEMAAAFLFTGIIIVIVYALLYLYHFLKMK